MSADKVIFIIICIFAVIGGIDRMIGNRFGLGAAFEKGILTMGPLLLTMSGMIVLAPVIADLLEPVIVPFYELLGADPAMFAGSFFACDMGGYSLAREFSTNENAVRLGGIIASSMLGVTITFTIPVAMGVVSVEDRPHVAKGILCGILTIPFGIFVGGLVVGCSPIFILKNMLPIIILALIIAIGLWKFEKILITIFTIFGRFMTALATFGLIVALIQKLTGWTIIKGIAPISESFIIVGEIALLLAGAFPLMFIVTKLLKKPLQKLGKKVCINESSMNGLLTNLLNSIPVFDSVKDMDIRGKVINMAFAVSASFVFGDHLAFTAGYDPKAILGLIAGKLTAGICALVLAFFITRNNKSMKGNDQNV